MLQSPIFRRKFWTFLCKRQLNIIKSVMYSFMKIYGYYSNLIGLSYSNSWSGRVLVRVRVLPFLVQVRQSGTRRPVIFGSRIMIFSNHPHLNLNILTPQRVCIQIECISLIAQTPDRTITRTLSRCRFPNYERNTPKVNLFSLTIPRVQRWSSPPITVV